MMATPNGFNPANDTHYGISEEDQFRLRDHARTLYFLGELFECVDVERIDGPDPEDVAALLRTLSYSLGGIAQSATVVFPGSKAA